MSSYSPLIFLLYLGIATAAVWIEYQKPQPGKAPFCTDKIEGKKKVGDIWQDQEECIQKRCLADSQGTPLISYAGCGAIGTTDPKCHLIEPDDNSTYPHCCPKIVCDD